MTPAAGRLPIDEALLCGRRGLRTRPGTLLLGPVGRRLWVDYLDDVPGFAGRVDFIHKINLPELFTISAPGRPQPSQVEWRPSHLTTQQHMGTATVTEKRFLLVEDVAVSWQQWRNNGSEPIELRLHVPDWMDLCPDGARGRHTTVHDSITVDVGVATTCPELWTGLSLPPGATVDFTVVADVSLAGADTPPDLPGSVRHLLDGNGSAADLLADHVAQTQQWYSQAPSFTSSDPVLDRTWWYRWFLLRHNMAWPELGQLSSGAVIYEGRSHKMDKTQWEPSGWEFSKLIPLSTPLHVLDLRWHADARTTAEVIRSAAESQGADGRLYSQTVDGTFAYYHNFLAWAVAEFAELHGIDAVPDVMDALQRHVERDAIEDAQGDHLPVEHDHKRTGKEYQPSYWHFTGYPEDPKDKSLITPLKRVDRAVYAYLNSMGVARLAESLGEVELREKFEALGTRIADGIETKMFSPEHGFYLDLHHRTDEPAPVKNVVGFYPWWADLPVPERRQHLVAAFESGGFGTGALVPSVSADCPEYAPGGGWKGRTFIKGRNGCMWNGPAWPYTNGVVLHALGNAHHAGTPTERAQLGDWFTKVFDATVLQHYHQQDGITPYLVEHYDSHTGEPISDEPDYNHSFLIDIIVTQVGGLRIRQGELIVDPVDIGLEWFQLNDVRIGSRLVNVSYGLDTDGKRQPTDGRELALSVDGVEVARGAEGISYRFSG